MTTWTNSLPHIVHQVQTEILHTVKDCIEDSHVIKWWHRMDCVEPIKALVSVDVDKISIRLVSVPLWLNFIEDRQISSKISSKVCIKSDWEDGLKCSISRSRHEGTSLSINRCCGTRDWAWEVQERWGGDKYLIWGKVRFQFWEHVRLKAWRLRNRWPGTRGIQGWLNLSEHFCGRSEDLQCQYSELLSSLGQSKAMRVEEGPAT